MNQWRDQWEREKFEWAIIKGKILNESNFKKGSCNVVF